MLDFVKRARREERIEDCTAESCGQHGYCTWNLNGRFTCKCDPGYKGNACQQSLLL